MFKENLEEELLVAWAKEITEPSAKQALWHIVGFGACSFAWNCVALMKGYMPVFRFLERKTDKRFFAFIPAQRWLLFYIRKPAINSGKYSWDDVVEAFPDAEQKSGEWRVRVRSLAEAHLLTQTITSGSKKA
jgi:hypothetical protein